MPGNTFGSGKYGVGTYLLGTFIAHYIQYRPYRIEEDGNDYLRSNKQVHVNTKK